MGVTRWDRAELNTIFEVAGNMAKGLVGHWQCRVAKRYYSGKSNVCGSVFRFSVCIRGKLGVVSVTLNFHPQGRNVK